MTVYESDLPGVGKKFEIEIDDDEQLVVVTHNTGKREVFRRRGEEDSEKLFELSDRLARQVGTILEGAYFQPVATETTETMLDDDTLFEWVNVVEGSELVDKTLAEVDFRETTGTSVVAIQRDDETESNPNADSTIRAGDTLVIIGGRDACDRVERLAAGTDAPGEEAAAAADDPTEDADTDA
ncbi:cation:proton antiporter regulatory subunit [Natronomonas gomsonensis]|uniref:cation:proton antiporter regulatory subunit n=1 Tax=Natronomonas gomsonensis TaxID=1046043 RepID=UPI0015BFAA65|nr:cation:proton antiporter regulatory subunit [Natronomonas gomsonensis]